LIPLRGLRVKFRECLSSRKEGKMPKNIKDILIDATKYPAAVEDKLPAGAPKISTMLSDVASKLPAVPDLPVEVPELPALPALPEVTPPGALGRYVTGVEVTPAAAPPPAAARQVATRGSL